MQFTFPSTSRTARIPKESTWILLPRQRGLRGYHRNSHGSFDLDKEGSTDTLGIRMDRAISNKQDCMDTLGIHMGRATLTSRIARIPEEFTSCNLYKKDCADT